MRYSSSISIHKNNPKTKYTKKYKHDQHDGSADKVLTNKLDNLSSVPRTSTEEGENQFSQIVLISTHASWHTYTHTHIQVHTQMCEV